LDPTTIVESQATGWVSQAASWGRAIYLSLLIFEVIALAITALLFRDNLGEFFAGVGLKVFLGGIYFWFINNAGTDANSWPQQIIQLFRVFGLRFAGLPDDTPAGTSPFIWLGTEGVMAAAGYIAAGVLVQTQNLVAAAVLGFYAGPGAAIAAAEVGRIFTYAVEGMGLMILMATAAIWLQLVIVTIESYIVMGAGILFIGFAGSRFTIQFSQGYFSYMLNVGVKFMVTYIVLAIEQPLIHAILGNSVETVATAALLGNSPAVYLALVPAAFGLITVLIAAALVWMIPGLAGSFLNGASSASGAAILGQAMTSMSAASQMFAAQQKQPPKKPERMTGAIGTGDTTDTASWGSNRPDTSTASGSAQNGQQSFAQSGSQSGSASGQKDQPKPPEPPDPQKGIAHSMALSAMAQAAPRDIGGPTAVQVRLGNPDKL
jgi:type IV secretion system protein TrbL